MLPWCERHDVALMAYSPFGSGAFPESSSVGGQVLASIARAHDATPHQVALAFLVRCAAVFAIPKAGSVEHAEENARAAALSLSTQELAEIERVFTRGVEPAELPTL